MALLIIIVIESSLETPISVQEHQNERCVNLKLKRRAMKHLL